jgi:glycosyltransferase involved in cell wall biosynthesis
MSDANRQRLGVIHVIDSLAATGGAERRLVEEVLALADRFDQRVVRLFERDDLQEQLERAGVPVIALGLKGRRAGRTWPLAAWRLQAELRRWRPDVVHTSLFTANLVGQLAARRLGIPVVSSFNRTGELALQRALQHGMAGWKGRTMQAIAGRSARADHVHHRAVSAYARDTNCASYHLSPASVTVVPRGIRVEVPPPSRGRSVWGLSPDRPLFVNAARVVPEKAQHLLVEAFADVRGVLPEAELAIAGASGPAEAAVRAAIDRFNLDGSVHVLGWRQDVDALIAAADVFVFSSLSEGSPSAVLEAMALGTPVVAFEIAPVAELTGSHAWLVPPGSTAGLAKAMVAAYGARDRAAEVEAARLRAEEFGLADVARRLGDLLASRARRTEPAGVAP